MTFSELLKHFISHNNQRVSTLSRDIGISETNIHNILNSRYNTQKNVNLLLEYYTKDITIDEFVSTIELIRTLKQK